MQFMSKSSFYGTTAVKNVVKVASNHLFARPILINLQTLSLSLIVFSAKNRYFLTILNTFYTQFIGGNWLVRRRL